MGGLGDESVFLTDPFTHAVDELFKDSDIQRRGGTALRMELSAQGKPVHHFAFDRFDDSIGAFGGDAESRRDIVNRHVVSAADADFAVTVDAANQRIADHIEGMAMVCVLRIVVGNRRWQVFLDVQEQISALVDVQ